MTLYAAYACNEGSGSTIIDYSGNSRSMTIAGTGNTWVTGHGSYPLAFLGGATTGAGASWNGGSADATLAGDVTAMCWAQSSNGATTLSFAAGLYSAVGTARLAMYSYRSLNATAASPELTVRNGAGGGPFSIGVNGSSADANWHHIAVVYHAAGTVDLYLDGTEVVTGASVTSAIGTTVQYLGVGALLPGAGANSAVQDFRVFSSALTAGNITTYMNTPVILVPGAAALSGTGAVTASPVVVLPAATALAGTGTLSGTGHKAVPGAAALSGLGTATATPVVVLTGAAALSGAGAVATSTVTVRAAIAGLHASPSLAATAQVARAAAAALSASAAASAAAQVVKAAAVALSGAAALSGAVQAVRAAGAGLSAAGHLSAVGRRQQADGQGGVSASAALTAVPALTCFSLSARIVMAANTIFPANQSGAYGATQAETTVTVPGVTDGIYSP